MRYICGSVVSPLVVAAKGDLVLRVRVTLMTGVSAFVGRLPAHALRRAIKRWYPSKGR